MSAPSLPELEVLTRQVARLKQLVAACIVFVAVTLVIAATPVVQDTIRGTKVEVGELTIHDEQGRMRARLDAAGLSVYDETGNARLQARLSEGTAGLLLAGGGDNRIHLAAGEDGHLGMYFFDNTVRDRIRLSLGADGLAGFTLFDDHYTWRTTLAVTAENEPSITVFDKLGHPVWRVPPAPEAGTVSPPPGAGAPASPGAASGKP